MSNAVADCRAQYQIKYSFYIGVCDFVKGAQILQALGKGFAFDFDKLGTGGKFDEMIVKNSCIAFAEIQPQGQ